MIAPPTLHPELERAWRESWSVPEPVSVSEWAQRRRVLDRKNSAQPGRWRNSEAPHAIEIMDAYGDPVVRKITLKKPSQSAGTESMYNMLFWSMEQAPEQTMLVYPTIPEMKKILDLRFIPALRLLRPADGGGGDGGAGTAFEVMEAKAGGAKSGGGSHGGMVVKLPRMNILCAGSNVASSLKSWPVCNAFRDEIDEHHESAEGLVEQRQSTYPHRKNVACSTPKVSGKGVDRLYSLSDQRRYHVPCPECAFYQELKFGRLRWSAGAEGNGDLATATQKQVKETIAYVCERCSVAIPPAKKRWMVSRGVWVKKGMSVHQEYVDAVWKKEGEEEESMQCGWASPPTPPAGGKAGDPHPASPSLGHPLPLGAGEGGRSRERLRMGAMFGGSVTVPKLGALDGPLDHAGFTWSKLISLFAGCDWGELAWEWVEAGGKPDSNWTNQTLGEADSGDGEGLKYAMVRRHFAAIARGGYRHLVVPREAILLTAAIDVQHDVIFVLVMAWGPKKKRGWLIHCDSVPAPITDRAKSAAAVAEVRRWRFELEKGHPGQKAFGEAGMPIYAATVDSGDGNRTDEIYEWTFAACPGGCELVPCKGRPWIEGQRWTISKVPLSDDMVKKTDRTEVELLKISNLYYKDQLAAHLRQRAVGESSVGAAAAELDAQHPGDVERWFWPAWDDETPWHAMYCRHAMAEERKRVRSGGRWVYMWDVKRRGEPNHFWDGHCYASAVADLKGVENAERPEWWKGVE